MSIPTKSLLFLFAICYMLFANLFPARAGSEFDTNFHSTYTIEEDAPTRVTHEITLTNQIAHLYTTEYTILVGSSNIDNISVTQDGAITNYLATNSDNSTTITLAHLTPVIGQGQSTILKISYTTPDITETLGRTRSINIPRLAKANEASTFTRTIIIPKEFGNPSAQYPSTTSISTDPTTGNTKLEYIGHGASSISLLFGESEYYELDLVYEITNPTLSAADTEVALPPDTSYQNSYLASLDPEPLEIKLDQDGNWLAVYSLRSKETLRIDAKLFLRVFASAQKTSEIEDIDPLTSKQPYWEIADTQVQGLAKKLSTPLNIYEYLVSNLVYDYSRLKDSERIGAAATLASPNSAICTEFTDSFVALARAAGIPARELNGFAYTTNLALRPQGSSQDILHAWPEYYEQSNHTWTQIDPTWANTTGGIDYFRKLDYNHLVFAIHGMESEYPLPAGSYKQDPDITAISVKLSPDLPERVETLVRTETEKGTLVVNTGNVSQIIDNGITLPPYGRVVLGSASSINLLSTLSLPQLYPYILFLGIVLLVYLAIRRLK